MHNRKVKEISSSFNAGFFFKMKTPKKITRSKIIKKLDWVFSEYIRLRDSDNKGIVTCPLCWKKMHRKDAQNMHFISRWVLKYRFDENNCYAWCMRCNVILHWNYIEYTLFMIKKFWKETVEAMKNDKQPYNIPTPRLMEMIQEYTSKADYLSKSKNL